jgi:hypothetical protein
MEANYGKCIENPILLKNISDSILFMNSLVSASGSCIIYHRKGSSKFEDSKPIDCYEVMTTDNKYDTFYINSYNKTNVLIPPMGYFFDTLSELYSKSRRNKNEYPIAEGFLMMDDSNWHEEETNKNEIDSSPTLLSSIVYSIGSNLKEKAFPFGLIKKHLEKEGFLDEKEIEKIVGKILPRRL